MTDLPRIPAICCALALMAAPLVAGCGSSNDDDPPASAANTATTAGQAPAQTTSTPSKSAAKGSSKTQTTTTPRGTTTTTTKRKTTTSATPKQKTATTTTPSSRTRKAPTKTVPSKPAKLGTPQKFSGDGDDTVGALVLKRSAVVRWTVAGGGEFAITDGSGKLKISGKGATGQSFAASGNYRSVKVSADGRWTLSFTPLGA